MIRLPKLKQRAPGFEFVTQTDAPHEPEHALEVELPFLQTVDLSHYNSYETAQRLDLSTAEAIEQGEWASFAAYLAARFGVHAHTAEGGSRRACGWVAVAGLLIETRRRGLGGYRLALCNSGDTAGSRDRVVGYGAWMFGEAD